ncbi:PIG-L deacetylase family protein [Candidatus Latescibacterota bacterium]
MDRQKLFGKAMAAGALAADHIGLTGPQDAVAASDPLGDVVIERDVPGKPHKGKVLLAVQAHLDDIPYYCGGTCAKLINEGYTGYLLRTSNDEKCGGQSNAENILSNERENVKMAKALGFTDVFDFYYRNHRMNNISTQEFRSRVVFLIRHLRVDTILSFNPWGHGEENPDHWVTGRVVEEACWMSGMGNDYPEHMLADVGIEQHGVSERYYYVGRHGQPYNRVVDIGSAIEQKIQSIAECKSQGGGANGSKLKAKLAKEGKRLTILGNNDETADREYVRQFLIGSYQLLGEQYGLGYAERFLYIDQRRGDPADSPVQKYIKENAVSM